jgi:hypothetical protein
MKHENIRGPAIERRLAAPHAACGAALVALFAACASAQRATPTNPLPDVGVTVSEVAENPLRYAGQVITVSGEVDRIFNPRAFTIGGPDFIGEDELLVVGPSTVPAILNNLADSLATMNDVVQVTGLVRVFHEDSIEQAIGADLDDDLFDVYDGKPVLVMRDLDITPRKDVVVAAVPVPVPVAVPVPVVDEIEIIDAPDKQALVGRGAMLVGVKVQEMVGDSAFWVGPSEDRRLFVVVTRDTKLGTGDGPPPELKAGQTIAVAGVIKPLPEDMATVRTAWQLSPDVETLLMKAPIYLVANRVMILDGEQMGAAAAKSGKRMPERKDNP